MTPSSSSPDPALLVGYGTGDDAAVYQLNEHTALVFTADFFTPIVDDARDWGRIAAANALSDVYAMGGSPLLCLNLVGWPRELLPLELLSTVLDGGLEVVRSAGAAVVGGHTIESPEPTYGMAVIGIVDPSRVVTNAAARPGDVLVLTKPVGIGVITTAIKARVAPPGVVGAAIEAMTTVNAAAARAMTTAGVRAATDVTGYGLLGHLQKMLAASGVSATVHAARVPVLDGARALADAGHVPGGTTRNREYLGEFVTFDSTVAETDRVLLYDAQTSGGLLIACPKSLLGGLQAELAAAGVVPAAEIGVVTSERPGTVLVEAT